MTKVEHRLLQLILSPVSGDRITLALLFWDGTRLRVASAINLGMVEPARREGIRIAAEEFVRAAEKTASSLARSATPRLDFGLAHVFPVREGYGAALYWAPIVSVQTGDADAYFAGLVAELRLAHDAPRRSHRVTTRGLHRRLVSVGEALLAEGGAVDRVRTDSTLHEKLLYRPPLSWKNGRWHHAVPFSLDGLDGERMAREVERVYGLVELSFPRDDVPVIVAALPSAGEAAAEGARDAEILRTGLAAYRAEIVVPERTEDGLGLEELAERVRRDIRSAA
jgi:hypothetical protein